MTPLFGVLAVIALIAAACGPAAEPEPTSPPSTGGTPSGSGSTGGGNTGGGGQSTGQNTSVSGVPLDPDAKYGGVLRTAATGEGPTINTWEEAAGNSFDIVHPVSNMLVAKQRWGTVEDFVAGAYWTNVPDLATRWEQSPDGLQWTFHLRDGVEWSDGTPFTCADPKWSFDTIRTGEGLSRSPRAVHFAAVSEITCPDDLTMVVTLSRPKQGFLEVISIPFHVIRPKHIYENNTAALREQIPEVGTGPYAITERIPGEKTVFARRDDYWDQPLPYLDGIEMIILASPAQVTALRGGRLDIGGSGAWSGAQAETLVRECTDCQAFPRVPHPGLLFALIPNQERAPWNTQEIKDALALAIDKPKLLQVGHQGWGALATGGLYLPGSFWAMPYERVKQIPGYDFENVEANQQRSRELIAQAGYQPNELRVEVTYSVGSLNYEPPSIPVIEDLNKVGFSAVARPLETALYYDAMSAATFDVGAHQGYIGGFDPDFLLYEYLYPGSDRNYGRYQNPEFARLVDLQSQTLDPEERRRLAWDAAEIAMRDQVRTFSGFQENQVIIGGRMRGYLPAVPSQASYGPWKRYDTTWLVE
jgi:ABC-type transport system substrate-binding protein